MENLTDELAALAHRAWCVRMLEMGWKPGKLLDPEAMTHDAIRPYPDLTEEDREQLRLRVVWDELEEHLAEAVHDPLMERELSARDLYAGMRVKLCDHEDGPIGKVVSWRLMEGLTTVVEAISVQWPDGRVVEFCPAERVIVPVRD